MTTVNVRIDQTVAILIDGNNIERSLHSMVKDDSAMINFDSLIPKILDNRGLARLIYFREGKGISTKLADRLHQHYHGSVVPCHKSADIPLSIKATQIAAKVDTIIILSGDSDYVELVRHLKGEGVRVEIAAVEATTAAILKEEADYFTPITEEDCFSFNQKPRKDEPEKKSNPRSSAPAARNSSRSSAPASKSGGNTSKPAARKPQDKPAARKAQDKPAARKPQDKTAETKKKASSSTTEKKSSRKSSPAAKKSSSSSRKSASSAKKEAPAAKKATPAARKSNTTARKSTRNSSSGRKPAARKKTPAASG